MNRVTCFIIISVTLIITGCGAMFPKANRLILAAQYGELERHMEEKVSSLEQANNIDLWFMCKAYAELKRYNKLSAGLAEMQRRIDRGDTDVIFLSSKINDLNWVHGSLNSRALIETGEYSKAVLQSQKTLEFLKGEGRKKYSDVVKRDNYVNMLEPLGLAYALNGQPREAEKCIRELEGISTSGHHVFLAEPKYMAIARINMALSRYDGARAAFEALNNQSQYQKEKASSSFITAVVLQVGDMWSWRELPQKYSYFKALLETGDVIQAKQGYDELLKIPQIKDNGPIYWMILFDRGRIAEQEGNIKQAIGFYGQAVDIIEQQRSTINTEASKIGFVGDKQTVYRRLIDVLFSDKQYVSALEYIERSKSRALVDMLAMKKDFAVQTGNEKQIRELLAVKDQGEQEALVHNELVNMANTRSVVIKTNDQLRQQIPELASLISVTSLSVAEIQKLIPADETLVEYYYTDKYLFIFILTSRGLSAVRLDSGHVAEDIKDFRASIEENTSSGAHKQLARHLFNLLIKPIEGSLSSSRLMIVPHGVLHYLPFYALHDGKDYLIERYSIRMLPSASMFKYLQKNKSEKPGGILAFGNPDLGDRKYNLVNAENEAVSVSKTLPHSKFFLRKDATETALKKYGEGFSYIHFATHGEFDADKPLHSALLLAADSASDGRLTVDKLYSMKLNADLVTLSACETGLGKISNGDDVVGLTRGFLYAGSSSIVASLWKVDDLATSTLMTSFYGELKKTDKRDALRLAQLQNKKKYPHPYYWASFQLTGNAQ
ncbi:MAG: CHAT domain-containing protein [Smithellaceae bacterium]